MRSLVVVLYSDQFAVGARSGTSASYLKAALSKEPGISSCHQIIISRKAWVAGVAEVQIHLGLIFCLIVFHPCRRSKY